MSLDELGFSRLTYSEVILSIRLKEMVNSAPMGAILNDRGEISLKIYEKQRTYKMILEGARDCVLNITDDPILFYNAIFEKEKIRYKPAKYVSSPQIRGCNAYIECLIADATTRKGYIDTTLKPLLIEAAADTVRAYSRPGPAIIEALICYSKIPHYKDVDKEKAEKLKKMIDTFREIVYHSTKDRILREIVTKILEKAKKI